MHYHSVARDVLHKWLAVRGAFSSHGNITLSSRPLSLLLFIRLHTYVYTAASAFFG